jgi:hypothetical protein
MRQALLLRAPFFLLAMSLLLTRGRAFVVALGGGVAAPRSRPPLRSSSLRTVVMGTGHDPTPHTNDDDDRAKRRRKPSTFQVQPLSDPSSPLIPQLTRDELIAQTKAKLAKVEAKKTLMVNARRDKMRRHKRKQEAEKI